MYNLLFGSWEFMICFGKIHWYCSRIISNWPVAQLIIIVLSLEISLFELTSGISVFSQAEQKHFAYLMLYYSSIVDVAREFNLLSFMGKL